MRIKIDDMLFLILILLMVGVALWKLFGSPTDTAAVIGVALFVTGSEMLVWKTLFKIDKKNSLGFMKIKNNIDNSLNQINNDISHIRRNIGNINDKLIILAARKR